MSALDEIRKLLQEDAKAKEVLKGPGVGETDKAGNATSKATHPEDDAKAKSSSKSERLKQEEEEFEDEELVDEAKKNDDDEDEDEDEDDEDKEDDSDDEDDKDDDKKSKKSKKADFFKKFKKENFDITPHVNALFENETLSEDFKSKAKVIFEAALQDASNVIRQDLTEEFEDAAAALVQEETEKLVEGLDQYLDYVVEAWMEENALQVESGLRNEISEEFILGLRNLFIEHNIEVPESSENILDEMAEQISELEARLNEEIDANIELSEALAESAKQEMIASYVSEMTDAEAEKFVSLTETLDFTDPEDFEGKLNMISESYFGTEQDTSKKDKRTTDEFERDEVSADEASAGNLSEEIQRIMNAGKKMKA